jgi:hypothetical protein
MCITAVNVIGDIPALHKNFRYEKLLSRLPRLPICKLHEGTPVAGTLELGCAFQ